MPPGFSARAAIAALGALGMLEDVAAFATDLEVTLELLAVGAAPLSDALGANVAERSMSAAGSLADGRALLETGAAGAVQDVTELYGVGLPEGLPGGLALVAICERTKLLELTKAARAKKAALIIFRAQESGGRGGAQAKAHKATTPLASAVGCRRRPRPRRRLSTPLLPARRWRRPRPRPPMARQAAVRTTPTPM